jgi:bacterioferritin-associated ferredoxin
MTLTITFKKLPSGSPHMIVCHCHGVTDREIRAAVHCGARHCADVADTCGAGSGCGGCRSLVADIVTAERRHLAVVRGDGMGAPRAAMQSLSDSALQPA